MTDMPEHARPEGWTLGQAVLASSLILLGLAITVPAFIDLYQQVTHIVHPWFGNWDWTVPVSGEIAFMYIWGTGILLAWRGEPGGFARPVLLAGFIAGSVYLNVFAAHGHAPDAVGHLLVVGAFFSCILVGKSTVLRLRSRKGKPDRMTAAEWLLHPFRSAALWSWMALWDEQSKARASRRRKVLLYAIALAQADDRIGRVPFLWRRRLPVTLRYQLSAGEFPAAVDTCIAVGSPWQEAVAVWVDDELGLLEKAPAQGTAEVTSGGTAEGSPEGTVQGISEGTAGGTPQGTRKGIAQGAEWPESRTVDKAVLVRRTRAAMKRYEDKHGKLLPATQLGAQLRLRMSRDTATKLLAEASAPSLSLAKQAVR